MRSIPALALGLLLTSLATGVQAQDRGASAGGDETWLPSLLTETPQEGFELAVTLARRGVVITQPDTEVLRGVRPEYAHDPDSLIAASQVIALHFQTIAAANGYWRSAERTGE